MPSSAARVFAALATAASVAWTSRALADEPPVASPDNGAPATWGPSTPPPTPPSPSLPPTPEPGSVPATSTLETERGPVRRAAFDGSVATGAEKLRKNLPELVWDRSYARFGIGNLILTGVGGAITLAAAILPPFSSNRRSGGILFDERARSALRASTFEGRYVARDVSDVFLSLATTYPFFIDALVSAWWFRGNADVARQMALIDAEAFAITGSIQGITNVFAARERPYGRICDGELPGATIDCTTTGRYRSFFSGHAAFSFTAAGLVCSHHLRLDLLGNKAADIGSCVVGYLVAGGAATLRVVGDMHYPSDVITGALVGTTVGLVVPWLHYKGFRTSARAGGVDVQLVPTGTGASVTGAF